MAGETQITLVGNLTADPELRFTPSGAAVANFTVASTPRTFDRQANEWRDGEALFLNCAVWRQAAENVAESLTKGMRVIVQGRLRARSYDDREGNRRTVFEVEVDEVGPALRFATAKVTRAASGGSNWQGNNAGGGQSRGNAGGGQPYGGGQQQAPQGNQGMAGGGQQGGNQGPVSDPWASAQSDEPPF
ncbi:single-stranded DNA-binding protein [Propionibacterium freudenreichii]|uniref:single-stranded DNA-binding protein n=1 Tax=Propionibacterium freudenreichii TaxID=1744 RepID=UPI00254E6DC3|nr:single-stranded DNA-binding protein [Propionibacterium freudenreichii]MDK9627551.1 single-stranded DNA-binding protein [Propionibacterium freudenreichii]